MNIFCAPVRRPRGTRWWWAVLAWLVVANVSLPAAPAPVTGLSGRSFSELLGSAEKGDPIAQRLVANAYLTGEGAKQDHAEAVRWLRQAAAQRDPYAQYVLGILHDEGRGVTRNLTEAVKWYELAAQQGLPDAQFNLGICYSKGEGVPKDPKKAAEWFRKAAMQGDSQSQSSLGLAYITANGVERNPVEAASWLRKAAYQDDPKAQYFLGRLYQEGEGVPQEFDTAVKWLRKSAQQGYADAQFHLGRALLAGEGVERNAAEARAWIEKAATQRHEAATQFLAQGPRGSASPTAAMTSPAPAATSPMTIAAARGSAADPNTFSAVPSLRNEPGNLGLTVPSNVPSTNAGPATGFREPITAPALPAMPTPPSPAPATLTNAPTTPKEATSLPPFTPGLKEPAPPAATPDIFTLPPAGKEAVTPPSFATEPPRAREPEPVRPREAAHEPLRPTADAGNTTITGLAWLSAMVSVMVLILAGYSVWMFKSRLQSLEAELKKAQFELSKANVNLSAMMHQVEQLSLAAPSEAVSPKTSLPEWNPEATKSHATSFKMHRSK